jgi:hypothetical protein
VSATRPRRAQPARRDWRLPAALLLAVAALLIGLALGRALEEGPGPAGTQTIVRTLDPRPLGPPARTVTVTVERRD